MTQPNPFERMQQQVNYAAQQAREAMQRGQHAQGIAQAALEANARNAEAFNQALKSLQVSRAGQNPGLQYVENIPGRRVPMDMLVDIAIGSGISSVQQGTILIPQNGPFVAVARMATFLSQYEYSYVDPETEIESTFQGRSYGRYRPIHSAWDINDGMPRSQVTQAVAFPGSGAPHIFSPANASSFRSMQPDFRVRFENAGSSFPRSNQEVPSTFWTKQINSPFELGALDVFERGEVMTFKVLPLHTSNPTAGNLSGYGTGTVWPFLGSQYDAVEGIDDTESDDPEVTTDPITRLPNGILTIGFHGYMIVQPPGAGPY